MTLLSQPIKKLSSKPFQYSEIAEHKLLMHDRAKQGAGWEPHLIERAILNSRKNVL